MNIIKSIKKIVGEKSYFRLRLFNKNLLHHKALKKVRKKARNNEKINVIFFLIHTSVWKYELFYKLLKEDERFNPIVLVCPYVLYGDKNMKENMESAYQEFKNKGYNTLKSLKNNGSWLDVKNELKPDIICFTNPHPVTIPQYYINNFKEYLTCYVPYNFGNSHMLSMFHDQDFHNLVWKLFAETEIHKEYSNKIGRNKGQNVIVTGFPGGDYLLMEENKSNYKKYWKHESTKKIIWAPHHTIDDDINFISFSSFLLYYEYMLSLLEQYENKIEIVFKPHPILKTKLYEYKDWGKERTDKYYDTWKNHPFGGLNESDYIGLFNTSDAMIHDSGSFLIEYLYTEKPVLRTDKDSTICERLNSFGKMAYNMHYIARDRKEIEVFVEEQVIGGKDSLKQERIQFKNKYLLPPNNKLASENIYNYIIATLV